MDGGPGVFGRQPGPPGKVEGPRGEGTNRLSDPKLDQRLKPYLVPTVLSNTTNSCDLYETPSQRGFRV